MTMMTTPAAVVQATYILVRGLLHLWQVLSCELLVNLRSTDVHPREGIATETCSLWPNHVVFDVQQTYILVRGLLQIELIRSTGVHICIQVTYILVRGLLL